MATEVSIHEPITPEQLESQTKALCDTVSTHNPEDTQALFGDLHNMVTLYYRGALTQASRSLSWRRSSRELALC
jgi:hypothetical protein